MLPQPPGGNHTSYRKTTSGNEEQYQLSESIYELEDMLFWFLTGKVSKFDVVTRARHHVI